MIFLNYLGSEINNLHSPSHGYLKQFSEVDTNILHFRYEDNEA